MSVKSINRTLNLAAFGMISVALCLGAWNWFSGEKAEMLPIDGTPTVRVVTTGADKRGEPQAQRDALLASEIWSRSLRGGFRTKASTRPETEKPPVAIVPSPVSQRPGAARVDLGLRLVGTVLENGNSMAIAIDRQGKLDFRKEGESFDLVPEGVRVETVLVDSIRVSYQGQDSTWRLGESLALNSSGDSETNLQASPVITPPGTSPPMAPTRKMTLEEELDFINGNQLDSSF